MEVSGIAMDSAGNVFVSGQAEDESGRLFWIVRQGTPQIHWIEQDGILVPVSTLTWSTSDQLQLAKFWPARANGITADAFGNVFVNGRAADAEGVDHFLVRRLSGVGPRFSVLRTSEGLQLAWSADARHCILQSASTLSGGEGWLDLNLSPAQINAQNVVSVPTAGPAQFFRLRQP